MFDVKLKAPKGKCLVAEVTRPINIETPERSAVGEEQNRYFARAGEKMEFTMSPGDDLAVAEFDASYRSLADLHAAETAKRDAEVRLGFGDLRLDPRFADPIMDELRVALDAESAQ